MRARPEMFGDVFMVFDAFDGQKREAKENGNGQKPE